MQRLLAESIEAGAWGWSTTNSPTHAGPTGAPVPSRLADDAERLALARTLGEFNRGIIEILPPSVTRPDEADQRHLRDVARTSGRPVFFLGFDAHARDYVEDAAREGVQLYNLLRAIPFNPRFTLKNTTFFKNLDVWDVVMDLPLPERLAALRSPERRTAMRDAAMQRQRRRPGVPGRYIQWGSIVINKVRLDRNRPLQGRGLKDVADESGRHVADVMLDLALEEQLSTEFQLGNRSAEEEAALVDMVKRGHALPSQSDAGAHLNTNYCTAGESSYVLSQWVRERGLLTLEDAVRRMSFQPARILGLHDRGLVQQGMAADLVVFDLARIGVGEDEACNDGPSGAQRRVQRAEGVDHVLVGGQVVLNHGEHTGALPGRVIRSGRRG